MKVNELNYCTIFEFVCSDGWGFATDNVELLKNLKDESNTHSIERFIVGDIIHIQRTDKGDTIKCKVARVDIRDIRFDTEEQLFGIWRDGFSEIHSNKEKIALLTIHVKLDIIK